MNVFEILIFVLALLFIVSMYKSKSSILCVINIILISITTLVTMLNGAIWHYYPMYIFVLISTYIIMRRPKKKLLLSVVMSVLLLSSIVSSLVFPYYDIPKPTGDFLIGTKVYEVEDTSRTEKYDNTGNKRRFKVQVWYPIDSKNELKRAPWLYDGIATARGLSKDSGLPYFLLDKLSLVRSNSYINAIISSKKDKYPVVIISHGWRGVRNLHQDFAEELASRGYIVFSIDHTYGAAVTVFENGGVTLINYEALPSGSPEYMKKANQLVNTYADDILMTIDYINELNQNDSVFKNKIDVEQIGLIGHSTGGGAGVRAAIRDKRVKAVVGLDPWVEPIKKENISVGLKVPSLILRSKQWEVGPNNNNLGLLVNKSVNSPVVYQIEGTTHYDFSMAYMYSSAMEMLGYLGSIDNHHLQDILKESLNIFFDKTLKNKKERILNLEQYENVEKVIFK